MAKLLCTLWALILHTLGVSIFETCFIGAMEDENDMLLLSSSAVNSFLFAAGVYTILVSNTLFPQSFRKPAMAIFCLYEFLVTAFFLEFATACIWTPIEALILDTLPKEICHMFNQNGLSEVARTITDKFFAIVPTFLVAGTFFLVALHVTKSVDFSVFTDEGTLCFGSHVKNKLLQRVQNELSKPNPVKKSRRKPRRRSRSKTPMKDYA